MDVEYMFENVHLIDTNNSQEVIHRNCWYISGRNLKVDILV